MATVNSFTSVSLTATCNMSLGWRATPHHKHTNTHNTGKMVEEMHREPVHFVHQDEIWKAHINAEKDLADAWPNKWGFLTQLCKEYEVDSMNLQNASSAVPPKRATGPPEVAASPPLPQTSQAVIGWRSAHAHLGLERSGMVRHGRRSFLKELGWPQRA
ncbi:ciliary microtubule inner protein 1-like [Vanacampus margaritifer]